MLWWAGGNPNGGETRKQDTKGGHHHGNIDVIQLNWLFGELKFIFQNSPYVMEKEFGPEVYWAGIRE